jgi:CO dehydrogenase/acetyl-CoA synthase gamma subunit (corrinoid Fe-S protein)
MVEDSVDARTVADIYRLLPGKNCGEKSPCGLPKCSMFANAVLKGKRKPSDCPYLEDDNMQSIILIIEEYFR